MVSAVSAQAQPYSLVPGDRLEIYHTGLDKPVTVSVDADGQVRMIDVGKVVVRGLTLDEAEARIMAEMVSQGQFVDPRVVLNVLEYAPVVVTGDVSNPGRYDYVPGMTVASALALAGGSETTGVTRTEVRRLRAQAEAQARTANLAIADAVARLAYNQALTDDTGIEDALAVEMSSLIPSPAAINLSDIVENQKNLLAAQRARTEELLKYWEQEITTIETQMQNYEDRIAVQQELVASATEALETAKALSERGLQTATRLTAAEEREADARSKVLELETAKINAQRAIASAKRARTDYLANQKQSALQGVMQAKMDLDRLGYEYDRAVEQVAILSGTNSGVLLASDTVVLEFSLQTLRDGARSQGEIDLQSPILPGDTLLVSVKPIDVDIAN
jgi:protein involved in polysaccharide export with SLBB domain